MRCTILYDSSWSIIVYFIKEINDASTTKHTYACLVISIQMRIHSNFPSKLSYFILSSLNISDKHESLKSYNIVRFIVIQIDCINKIKVFLLWFEETSFYLYDLTWWYDKMFMFVRHKSINIPESTTYYGIKRMLFLLLIWINDRFIVMNQDYGECTDLCLE